ncbi:hypothetical protein KIN34_01125 [Cellulomonas sp. DKR-3]|uniref:Uncharacterized protein n=1 Tax=Cellulomonas fulva TaxID=2835530 RepID=A0ABS5TUW3_9CELL|nr:hypothetical protein [Cellulomonas fulva]MBT0992893.1 hypothetical protein [Cellulomonas fulva]
MDIVRSVRRTSALAVAVALLAAGSGGPAAAAPVTDLTIRFDQARGGAGAVAVDGLRVTTGIRTANGGSAAIVAGRAGQGNALRLPRPGAGQAILSVRSAVSGDRLSPGTRAFTFGADVRRDSGGSSDGDNLVQRGLADDAGQYKIELDGGRAACTVKGRAGKVIVTVGTSLAADVWYRVRCTRGAGGVKLTVTDLRNGSVRGAAASSPTGAVATRTADTPLSVGGKLTPRNGIATWQPDQLNGTVDNVVLTIG